MSVTDTQPRRNASRHPEYDNDEVRRAYLRLCWGDELFAAVFPGAPLPDP